MSMPEPLAEVVSEFGEVSGQDKLKLLLEFADARIRSGVWDHSTYKADPIGRSRRTVTNSTCTITLLLRPKESSASRYRRRVSFGGSGSSGETITDVVVRLQRLQYLTSSG